MKSKQHLQNMKSFIKILNRHPVVREVGGLHRPGTCNFKTEFKLHGSHYAMTTKFTRNDVHIIQITT